MAAVTYAEQVAEYHRRLKADPLTYWQAKSWAQRALLSCWLLFRRLVEVYWHASNSGGKTNGGAVLALSLLQRRREVGGIKLPEMPEQVFGVLLVHSYKQALLSSIKALRELYGETGYKEDIASDDCPGAIYIRPLGCKSDDHRKWSLILVFPRDGEIPDGLRLDFAWADEPPDEEMWRELRFRGISGHRYFRFITATPKKKKFWKWLLADFEKSCGKEVGRKDDWRVTGSRMRIQSSVYDNEALTAADIRRAEEDAENDEEKDARLYGDHVDSTGSRPWPYEILMRWKARCRLPDNEKIVLQELAGRSGRLMPEIAANLQIWAPYDELDTYIVFGDPAKGIKDDKHDPDGLHVWSVRRNALVARSNEYIGAFMLGKLMAKVGRMYGNALLEPLVTGGFGTGLLAGIESEDYVNVTLKTPSGRVGAEPTNQLGYTETADSHDEMSEALLRAMQTDSAGVWCHEVVDALLACVRVDGKIVAEVGGHAKFRRPEDFVLAGRAQVVIGKIRGGQLEAEVPRLDFGRVVQESMGRHVEMNGHHEPVIEEAW